MSVYIFQADALSRLAAVEGEAWLKQQGHQSRSPYGFHAWHTAWLAKTAAGPDYADSPVRDFLDGSGDGAIYGDSGYDRYVILPDGEVVLLAWSARHEKRLLATAQGIRVLT